VGLGVCNWQGYERRYQLAKNKVCKRKVLDHWSTKHGPNNIRRQKQSLEDSWGPNGGQRTEGLIHKIVGLGGELMNMSDKKATDIQTHF
jgi:hypothetical protein